MLEDTFEEIKLTFSKNAIPYATTEEGFVKTLTNNCLYSSVLPKNNINNYKTNASLADAVKSQASDTKLLEAIYISHCSLSDTAENSSSIHKWKSQKLSLFSQPPNTCPFPLGGRDFSADVRSQQLNGRGNGTVMIHHLP